MGKQGVRLHVWGEYALFTRPEMKVERVSYDVITPSAARGIIEAIYWKPEIRWHIDRLHVLKPIRSMTLRRNEVASKVPTAAVARAMKDGRGRLGLDVEADRQQRAALVLRDVAYVIEARFDLVSGEDNPGKHLDQFNRRARAGQCHTRPYLGCREFDCHFALIEGDPPALPPCELPPDQRDRDLGYVLHDIDFANGMAPRFFRAKLTDGVIDVPPWDGPGVVS